MNNRAESTSIQNSSETIINSPSLPPAAVESDQEKEKKMDAFVEEAVEEAIKGASIIGIEEGIAGKAVKAEMPAVQSGIRVLLHSVGGTALTHPIELLQTRKVFDVDTKEMGMKDKLFFGFKQNLAANVIKSSILFGSMPLFKHQVQYLMPSQTPQLTELVSFVCASMLEAVMWTPVSLCNLRMRIEPDIKNYKQALACKPLTETIRAISKGAFWGSIRNGIFSTLFFSLLKEGEKQFITPDDTHSSRLLKTLAIGAAAGIPPAWMSYCIDVVQKKSMDQPHVSTRDTIKKLWNEGGIKGLWKGGATSPLRMASYTSALGCAMVGSEVIYHQFNKSNLPSFFNHHTNIIRQVTHAMSGIAPDEEEITRELYESSTRP